MIQLLKERARAAIYSTAVVLVLIQWILPGLFDFILDAILLALLIVMDKINNRSSR